VTRDRDIPLLTVAEAAKHAKVDRKTITRWIQRDLMPGIPNGKETLVPLDHLQRVIRERHERGGGRMPRRHARKL
jgi:excisionase family DNA binding protein